MCCLCECSLCEYEDENFECPAWEVPDVWLDLESEWEAPEWINLL